MDLAVCNGTARGSVSDLEMRTEPYAGSLYPLRVGRPITLADAIRLSRTTGADLVSIIHEAVGAPAHRA